MEPETESGLRVRTGTPSLWQRSSFAGFGGWRMAGSEATAVMRPLAPQATEQNTTDPSPLCASQNFIFMVALLWYHRRQDLVS